MYIFSIYSYFCVFVFLRLDGSDSDSNGHQYESVEDKTIQGIACDDFDGSFDSDSSFDDDDDNNVKNTKNDGSGKWQESFGDRRLPSVPVPQNESIYSIMKQAGRHMRKHWSIGESLRRIKKMSASTMVHNSSNEDRCKLYCF